MKSRLQQLLTFALFIAINISPAVISDAADTLQILEKEQKLVLTGEISKALGTYDQHLRGAVEYLVCGRGGKEYESIIVVDSTAKAVHEAMLKLGVKRGTPPTYDADLDKEIGPQGTGVVIHVEWEENGSTKRVRGEDLLYNVRTEKTMKHAAWVFSGSRMVPDLESEDLDARLPQAFMSNDIVALNHLDASALFQNPHPEAAKENTYKKNDEILPPLGTPVKLTIEVSTKMQLYILISGKVQGVGFRAFTQRNARQLGLRGYAKNLPNGKVEAVVEGDKSTLDALVKVLRKGPPASRVDDVKIDERPYSGTYKAFEIQY